MQKLITVRVEYTVQILTSDSAQTVLDALCETSPDNGGLVWAAVESIVEKAGNDPEADATVVNATGRRWID